MLEKVKAKTKSDVLKAETYAHDKRLKYTRELKQLQSSEKRTKNKDKLKSNRNRQKELTKRIEKIDKQREIRKTNAELKGLKRQQKELVKEAKKQGVSDDAIRTLNKQLEHEISKKEKDLQISKSDNELVEIVKQFLEWCINMFYEYTDNSISDLLRRPLAQKILTTNKPSGLLLDRLKETMIDVRDSADFVTLSDSQVFSIIVLQDNKYQKLFTHIV